MKTEHLLKRKTLAKYYIHLICIVLLHILKAATTAAAATAQWHPFKVRWA